MGKRVCIFIDGQNLYFCLKDSFGNNRIDFGRFIQKLVGDRELIRAYYYNSRQDHNAGEDKFYKHLARIPYLEVKLGRYGQGGEKTTDILLAIDMLILAFNNVYDVAVLVSGDGDFVPAVEEVKRLGKHVEVVMCPVGRSYHLAAKADKRWILSERDLEDCWLVPRPDMGGAEGEEPLASDAPDAAADPEEG